MALEIEITDNTTSVLIRFENSSAGGFTFLHIPKNSAVLGGVNGHMSINCGPSTYLIETDKVTIPVGVTDTEDLRNKVEGYFYV